jgi:hypothetical protein
VRDWWISGGWEMSSSTSGKRGAEPQQEESCRKRKDGAATSVTVELEVLDCPVCYEPLRPPIFQVHSLSPKIQHLYSKKNISTFCQWSEMQTRVLLTLFGLYDNVVPKMFCEHLIYLIMKFLYSH